ncbi:unnamed protein product [Heligmosomoides polygyrus]|uniref:DUF7083 domain-containing protein n=1 Tax=Heligmosomoides polygyrus TaxID=6339 RepID=A0A183GHL4_HELPZ|nr:unnamed protein product [Heligmosomoides polygyrus]
MYPSRTGKSLYINDPIAHRPRSPSPDITSGDQKFAGLPRRVTKPPSSANGHYDGRAVSAVADSPSSCRRTTRTTSPPAPSTPHGPARQFDAFAGRIAPFVYDTDADLTFESWYRRYDDVFNVDATDFNESTRTLATLKDLFGPSQSLLSAVPIFVCGLQSSDEAFIRLKLLDKIEADPNCTAPTLTEECRRLLNLRHDTQVIEDGKPAVQAIE